MSAVTFDAAELKSPMPSEMSVILPAATGALEAVVLPPAAGFSTYAPPEMSPHFFGTALIFLMLMKCSTSLFVTFFLLS